MSLSNRDEPSSDTDPAEINNSVPDTAAASEGVTPTRLLKMKEIMENQCFEMNVKVSMGKHKESYEADADLSKYESEIEKARLSYFNKTLVLNRMQIWNVITEKIIQNDADAEALKELTRQNTEICEKTMKILKETRELQDQITDIQKERLDLKGQIKKKMQEINELKQVKENQGEVQQRAKERAEAVLQKYQKVTTILQNVLRGIILASKVNWRDDPKLRDIAMGLENIPN
ncbi:centromere protein H [Carassius auratus]|uniref:Centromere protein H-like n=1 Tax=Carassius auratus TaxID=7957 RepID=A0A6P6PVB7_CARAU|nr:centromere protein H-like [Carassius auratus]XP_026125068.1 centromere protein H-like [Carassius auratus]XP_026125069.1 centromere protein H-like [Carassius auratus]